MRATFRVSPTSPRSGSVARWVVAVAVLAVLTVLVTVGINMFGGDTREVQVPDVSGQVSADAIAALQNRGFSIRTQQQPDSEVPPDHVISTDPEADSSVAAGDEITVNVSTGPEQREVPDVSGLTYGQAVEELTDGQAVGVPLLYGAQEADQSLHHLLLGKPRVEHVRQARALP